MLTREGESGRLLAFLAITFAVTWTCFIAAGAMLKGQDVPAIGLPTILLLLGTIAPSLVALSVTAAFEGTAGAAALLRRLLQWDVAGRWYVFAVSYMVTIKLTVAVLHRVGAGFWPRFGSEPWFLLVAALFVSTPVQAGEEIGWRGYALPRLAATLGLGGASLLLGVIWATWHLPLFFIPGIDQYGQSFPVWTAQVTALSVAIGWLYGQTNGSLPLVMVMHSAVNQSVGIVPSALPGAGNPFGLSASPVSWLTLALLWIPAAYFLARMPARNGRGAGSEFQSL